MARLCRVHLGAALSRQRLGGEVIRRDLEKEGWSGRSGWARSLRMMLGYPVGAHGPKVVNVNGTFGEDDHQQRDKTGHHRHYEPEHLSVPLPESTKFFAPHEQHHDSAPEEDRSWGFRHRRDFGKYVFPT